MPINVSILHTASYILQSLEERTYHINQMDANNEYLYRELILEHWKNPQNSGVLDHADIDIHDSNPLCGDEIRITATIRGPTLTHIQFIGQGCAISQASASIFTSFVKNMPTNEIMSLSQEDFLMELGITLTPTRLKCALLPYSTLKKGLTAFTSKT